MKPDPTTPQPPAGGAESHTPTPWKIVRRHPDPHTNANYCEIMPEVGGCWGEWSSREICALYGAMDGSIQLANASLIVAAVNSHASHLRQIAALRDKLAGALRLAEAENISSLRFQLNALSDVLRSCIALASEDGT